MPVFNLRKYYLVNAKCSNCKKYQQVRVLRGIILENYFKNVECENCGCKTLILEDTQGETGLL